jgi:hypothetical protein
VKNIYPLNEEFGLLEEGRDTPFFISLICLDLHQLTLKKLHTVDYSIGNTCIFVNKVNPTTFIFNDGESTRICKIVDKTIIIENVIEITFNPDCFYDKFVYALNRSDENNQERAVRILYMPS